MKELAMFVCNSKPVEVHIRRACCATVVLLELPFQFLKSKVLASLTQAVLNRLLARAKTSSSETIGIELNVATRSIYQRTIKFSSLKGSPANNCAALTPARPQYLCWRCTSSSINAISETPEAYHAAYERAESAAQRKVAPVFNVRKSQKNKQTFRNVLEQPLETCSRMTRCRGKRTEQVEIAKSHAPSAFTESPHHRITFFCTWAYVGVLALPG